MTYHSQKIEIYTPGTVANLVCGFDVLGLAISSPKDKTTMNLLPKKKIIIRHEDDFGLPEDPRENVAAAPLFALLDDIQLDIGFELSIHKTIKPGSGLGSSASSAVAAIAGANYLLGGKLSPKKMIEYAMFGEKLATGVKHADNIAPCLLGGITLIRSIFPLDVMRLPYPEMFVTVIHPQIEIKTSDARSILRKNIPLKDAIKQWGNIAGLVAGLCQKDYDLISRSMTDIVIEPTRSILIPGFQQVKEKIKQNTDALGGGISGSGPSIFMLSKSEKTAQHVKQIMNEMYTQLGMDYITYISPISDQGVEIKEV